MSQETLKKFFREKKKRTKLMKLTVLLGIFFFSFYWIGKHYLIHPVAGTSMEDSLHDGDKVFLNRTSPIVRYSVIGFSVPGEEGMFVKRVLGVPGDHILIQGNRLILSTGNEEFTTTYRFDLDPNVAQRVKGSKVIPPKMYFVIGDHASVSKDSRSFGWVKKENIEGKVQYKVYPLSKIGPMN